MKLFKLTDENGRTYGGTQWGKGVTHRAPGRGLLCSAGWVHAYEHPLLAVLLNPIHANFSNPRLWEAEGEVGIRDGQLKCGTAELTTVREIPLPEVTTEIRVRFAILCALEVYKEEGFVKWAQGWLSGEDRGVEAARAAWAAAEAAQAAAQAAARAAEWAAQAAAEAARAAAREKQLDLFSIAEAAFKGATHV